MALTVKESKGTIKELHTFLKWEKNHQTQDYDYGPQRICDTDIM